METAGTFNLEFFPDAASAGCWIKAAGLRVGLGQMRRIVPGWGEGGGGKEKMTEDKR